MGGEPVDAIELKQYIINNDKIVDILESLECHHIKEFSNEYRAGLNGHSSTDSVSVRKDDLFCRIYNPDMTTKGDIFSLCQTIKDINFSEANKYLHKVLGLQFKYNAKKNITKDKIDPLEIFKRIKKKRDICNVNDIPIYDEEILKDYIPLPHINLIREDGIMPWTCKEFAIGYSDTKKRIIFPERYWCGDRYSFVGIIGRTVVKEYSMLDIPKYLAIKPFSRGLNLYGLNENYKHIQEAGYVVVLEGQKGVLKRHSRNDKTCVASGGHELSQEQVRILISLNVDIIISWDNDISLKHTRATCEKFYGIRNVYYMFDRWKLLGKKDSSSDLPNKLYNFMFKYKVAYDDKEHREFLKESEHN